MRMPNTVMLMPLVMRLAMMTVMQVSVRRIVSVLIHHANGIVLRAVCEAYTQGRECG